VNKIQLLLSTLPGSRGAALSNAVDAVAARLPSGAHIQLLRVLADDPSPHLTVRYPHLGAQAPHFDVIVELESPSATLAELAEPLTALRRALTGCIDPAGSGVIAGVEHTIVAGDGPLVLVYPIRRVAALSPEAFWDRWFRGHVQVASDAGNLGKFRYRQLHSVPDATTAAAAAIGVDLDDFDGAAIGFYDDREQFIGVAVDPDMRIEDELHFIDHARSTLAIFERVPPASVW
jgi:hypothetical protein